MGAKLRLFLDSIRQHFFPAERIFTGPLLRYVAEFSAIRDWEHCLWVAVLKSSCNMFRRLTVYK